MATLFLLGTAVNYAGTDIGTESAQVFPESAKYSSAFYLQPGEGTTNDLNPPIFVRSYFTNALTAAVGDTTFWEFQRQVATNAAFTGTLFANKRTLSNLENRFAPFTNADGSTYSNALYWRDIFIGTNGLTNFISPTNTFYLRAAAVKQDRSPLADATKLASFTHPWLLLTPTNRSAVYQFVQTNDAAAWAYITIWTNAARTASWWTNPAAWSTNYSGISPLFPGTYTTDIAQRSLYLGNVLFVYGMTNLSVLTNELVMQYTNLVEWALGVHYQVTDYGSGSGGAVQFCIVYGYDWLFHLLSPTAKARAELWMDQTARTYARTYFWSSQNGNGDGSVEYDYAYNPPRLMPYYSAAKNGTSHQNVNAGISMISALGAFQVSTNAREFFDLIVNWDIARGHFAGGFNVIHQGRGYASAGLSGQSALYNFVTLSAMFPEAQLHLTPTWQGVARWVTAVWPPGYFGVHDPHADAGGGLGLYMSQVGIGQKLALFTRSGETVRAHRYWTNFFNPYNDFNIQQSSWPDLAQTWWIWNPASEVASATATNLAEDGYVIANTGPLNAIDSFTNQIGFVLAAPPQLMKGHASEHHGDVELWAYGAPALQSGGYGLNQFGYYPESHNSPKVDGYGTLSSSAVGSYGAFPNVPAVGKVIYFTNTADFAYAAVDLSAAFTNRFNTSASNKVQSATRHVFLSRTGKYVAIYDHLVGRGSCELAVNLPIEEATLTNLTSTGFRFGATNRLGASISNHVFQVASGFTITNLVGARGLTNPVNGTYYVDTGAESVRHAYNVWFRGTSGVTNHSLLVLGFEKPGDTAPAITRLDDNTFKIVSNGVTETNTWGTNYAGAYTYRIATLDGAVNSQGGGGGAAAGSRAFAAGATIGRRL